jgi:hypothetical protein
MRQEMCCLVLDSIWQKRVLCVRKVAECEALNEVLHQVFKDRIFEWKCNSNTNSDNNNIIMIVVIIIIICNEMLQATQHIE